MWDDSARSAFAWVGVLFGLFLAVSARAQLQPPYTLVPAFTRLPAAEPIHLEASADGSGRLFVAEKGGLVRVFSAAADSGRVFLDLRAKARAFRPETGLLGMALHPRFSSNGRFFVHYSGHSFRTVVSEFRVSADDPWRADPKERFVLVVDQPTDSHNGGQLAFGPDGYLYLGLGDGGGPPERPDRGQDRTTLLGKILRLDVDVDEGYAVPGDNPFVGNARGWREEIWAYGLRNPWRFSFGPAGGLWVGDVGEDSREEINLVERGGNYGWARAEGEGCRDPAGCGDLLPPLFSYGREEGVAVIGGHVYGGRLAGLEGLYLFGDFGSRQVWGLRREGDGWRREHLATATEHILAFGRDADGETYVLTRSGVWRFAPGAPYSAPPSLAGAGLFADMQTQAPADGVLPYAVNAPLWSDGAAKRRYIKLPPGGRLRFDPVEAWGLPDSTVLVKSFYRGGRAVETRLLVKRGTGLWDGFSYRWNEAGTDALLLAGERGESLAVGGGRHFFPSRAQCGDCHTPAAGYTLGWRTGQLDRDDQIEAWAAAGLFDGAVPPAAERARWPEPGDGEAPLESRVRAYLAANCAGCHRPGVPIRAGLDLRFATPLEETGLGGAASLGQWAGTLLVQPGSPERSAFYRRLLDLGAERMPPLASSRVDTLGAALVAGWIGGLAGVTAVDGRADPAVPRDFALLPPYPNPANAALVVPFRLAHAGQARLELFDLAGQRLETLFAGHLEAGTHRVRWHAAGRASGAYLVRLSAAGGWRARKLLLLR